MGAMMTRMKLILIVLFAFTSGPIFACACDEECKDGEHYSDEAEMCVANTA